MIEPSQHRGQGAAAPAGDAGTRAAKRGARAPSPVAALVPAPASCRLGLLMRRDSPTAWPAVTAAPEARAVTVPRARPAPRSRAALALALAASALAPATALAHHPLDGVPMTTAAQGLLSGLAHPVLGFDHLFFVAVAGVAAALAGARLAGPLAYVAAMLAGCALMGAGLGLPAREAMIVLSLLVVGGLVAAGRSLGALVLPLLAGFGLFHGSAFGEAIAGQEAGAGAGVLGGYLLGLGLMQHAIALGAGTLALRLGARAPEAAPARVMGALAAGAGLLLALEAMEGAAFAALGLG